jgi:hypothetical protein
MSATPNICAQITTIQNVGDTKSVVFYQTEKECQGDAMYRAGKLMMSLDGNVSVAFQCVEWARPT